MCRFHTDFRDKICIQHRVRTTSSFELFSVNFNAYLCFDFTQISATKYVYSIECAIETGLLTPARVYIRPTSIVNVTAATACNRESPTDKSDFSLLVKEGTVGSLQAIATCPNDFLATFNNFTVTGYSGANQCTGNSLDVCTDRTAMNYTYNSCSSSVKFSSGGYFYCLYYQTNSSTGVTYLHVYNNDSTVVSGSTYRIVCYAFRKSGNTIFTTEYPGNCHGNQNDTYVKSPGIVAEYFNVTKTCAIVVGSQIQDWRYIVAICCGFVGLIILIVVTVIVIKTRIICKCCASLSKKCAHGVKVTQSQGDMEYGVKAIQSQRDTEEKSDIFTAKQKNRFIEPNPKRRKSFAKEDETRTVGYEVALYVKDEGNEVVTLKKPSKFVPRKPRKIKNVTFIIKSNRHIETLLHIPFMPELLYQVVPRPTSSRRMFYRTPTFMSEKSLDKIGIVSQNQQEKLRR
ncbi:hypothetical protein CHS0354_018617 [Potamilus streckersoni]|uniref:Uncharacterized protein n=1 Tax=Potamilus streckersoni TaxID=2493646 RepID=A0AAE0VY55_9BIVA|nr:hypothetical protein CHS0354_018617 [Potamilus streckersoni]